MDVYASGSLGPATTHTVSRLPLNGKTLYFQLHRRIGNAVDITPAQYIAPFRKGVAIITDFANRSLEDWTGPGIKTVDDLSVQLRSMEQHWAWLSRGLERMQWDIIRIQLPQPAVADAYDGWGAFRDAAITLARQQVRTSDYDVNSDGVIDAAWLMVSSGNESLPFALGGASRNAGANLFVDGQASGSIQAGATGNFNHELGHTLGLPDMYGAYGTMSSLTVMSYSWPVPPPDFSAYERIKLGWLTPQVISKTTQAVWLPSANETFAAVKVPTSRPFEYFLIEYRHRPANGYGSADVEFNGLAVYHVLEGSSMWQNPPLMKLEPADGSIAPSQPADPNDFLSPDNPAMILPLTLLSYFGGGQEVFRLDNLAWRDGGLAFDIIVSPQQPSSNLLANGSFETGAVGLPDRWLADAYSPAPGAFGWPNPVALTGAASAHLNVQTDNDVRWTQAVTTLVPGQPYLLCGWLKGEQVGGTHGEVGANVSLMGGFVRSEGLLGTFDWTQSCVGFTAETPRVDVACRLGFYGSTISGQVWCDDFTLEHVRKAF
jgi:M6 family metalloprotease-like protein